MTVKLKSLGTGSAHPGFEKDMFVAANANMVEDICPLCDGEGMVVLPSGKSESMKGKEEDVIRETLPREQSPENDNYVWFRKLAKVFMEKPASADACLIEKHIVVVDSSYSTNDKLEPEDCTMIVQNAIRFASVGAVLSEEESTDDNSAEENVSDD